MACDALIAGTRPQPSATCGACRGGGPSRGPEESEDSQNILSSCRVTNRKIPITLSVALKSTAREYSKTFAGNK